MATYSINKLQGNCVNSGNQTISSNLQKNNGIKTLIATCGAHAIQDGMMAVQYVLLPVLAQSLGLSYTQVGILKAASSTSMSLLEIPSGFLADKFSEKRLLCAGLAGVGAGYIGVASSNHFFTVCLFFLLAGSGAAFQHSLSSALLVQQFEGGLRRSALGTYNSFGDLGKLTYAGAFSLLLGMGLAWSVVVLLMAFSAISFGFVVWWLLSTSAAGIESQKTESKNSNDEKTSPDHTWGITKPVRFLSLSIMVFLDSIVQAAFLTFIAFVLVEKGASASHAAGGVVLTLIGGTAGKFAGGLLAARMGDRHSFFILQCMTILGIIGVLYLPLQADFITLPIAGVFVQGSSTVCYGAVADYVDAGKTSRAYAIIYTLSSAASVVGPFFLGVLADHVHIEAVLWSLIVVTAASLLFGISFSNKVD